MKKALFFIISVLMSVSTTATNISGSVNASALADNSDIVLTGNTNLYMDVNKTIKTLNAAYPLTISGGNILTVNNPNGDAITSDGDISISGSKLVVKAKSNGIYSANGNITLDSKLDITVTNGNAVCANLGNVSISKDTKIISTSSTKAAIQAGYYGNAAYKVGSVTITGGTVNVNSQYDAIKAIGGAIDITGNVTLRSNGKAIFAFGFDHSQTGGKICFGNINLNGTFDIEGSEYAIGAAGGDVTLLSGSIKTIGSICTEGDITLNGNVDVTASTNLQAIWAYGKVNITGNVKAVSEASDVPAIQGGYHENAAYKVGSVTITGGTVNVNSQYDAIKAIGGAIDITGNVTLRSNGKAIFAFGFDHSQTGGKICFGNINLNGTFDIEGSEYAIGAAGGDVTLLSGSIKTIGSICTEGDITLNGNVDVTASTNLQAIWAYGKVNITGNVKAVSEASDVPAIQGGYHENAAYKVGSVTITGGTVNVNSQYDAIKAIGGDIKLTGNMTITSANAVALLAFAFDHTNIGGPSYRGNIILGKGDYKITGAGYAVYAAGNIAFNTSLAILTPTNGKIYNHTIVDEGNNTATFVHIGYTPKVTQNVLSATNTVKYGEQLRIEGTIKAIGQTNYKLQESADGTTWRTIKSGTIATNDARTGHTVQYKKVLTETGYEAYRQYRMIANHVGSGEQDTSAIKRVYYKYPLFRDGFVTAYYGADETFNYAKPADCRDYRYTSNLPARVQENSDYLKITMPACPLYIDEYTPTYKVDFYDADATLLKSEEVIAGNDATPPAMDGQHAPASDPSRAKKGTFTGWSKDYTNVRKPLNVFAKYDVYVNLDMDMAEHICNRNEDWKFASWMFTQFENNKTMAMVGDSLTFRASVKTNTPVTVYFQSGAPLGNGEISWTTGTQVGEITGYDVNKVMTFDRQVTALVEYYNELPFERKRYYRFYAHGNGTAQTVYSETMEIQMYYPLLVNADQEVQVLTSEGGFYFNGLRSVIPVQYNETVLVLDRKGMKGAGLTLARVNKPAYLIEGYTDEGVHYMLGPGVTETLNVTTTKKLIVFDGVYGNGYPKQLDFTAEGFGKVNGYYGEVVPCGGSVTMPADPTEENAIFLGWSSWDPSSYDSLAYLNVPAISDNILGFTANFEYYDPTPQYTVRFYGKDGAPLLDTQVVDEGKDATPPTAPEISGWHFTGWDKPYTTITEDVNITAIYGEDIKVWTVTYKNWDGSSLGSEQVNDGEAATGVEVAREGYTFVKWRDYFSGDDVDMQHITANITVEPVFTETLYTVTYRVNGVETYTVQAVHGLPASSIYYPLGTPTKEPTEALVYTFAYWTPDVETITEDVTFEAVFVPAPRKYTITFQNWDHTLLSEQQVVYGNAAVAPSVPARDGYFFDGWDRGFDVTLADMTVTAVFRLPGKYTISWLNDDASLIEQTVVAEGVVPTHADPTKQATAEFTYTFAGWTPTIVAVTADATYTATYNETVNKYTITATAENGTVQGTGEYDYGTVVELMAIADTGYKFDKWSDEVTDNPRMVTVTENMEFTALFISDVGASIEDIHATSNKVQKVLIDGILYILRDGKTYNTMGQEM